MRRILILLAIILSMVIAPVANAQRWLKDVIIHDPDGIWADARAYADLATIVATVGSDDVTLMIAEPITTGTLTIPANMKLKFSGDGEITATGLVTILSRWIDAEFSQIFVVGGGGSFDFANGSVVKASWFEDVGTALTQVVNDNVRLRITEPSSILANVAIGTRVTLEFGGAGCAMSVAPGINVTNLKDIIAGDFMIFTGGGDFDFAQGAKLNSAWFRRIRSAPAYIGADRVELEISRSEDVDQNITFGANTSLKFVEGGELFPRVGVSVTVYSPDRIIAYPPQQIIDITSNSTNPLIFTNGGTVYPEWWGIDGAADNVQFQLGVNSLPRIDGGVVQLSPGQYSVTGETTIEKHSILIRGAGNRLGRGQTATDYGSFIRIAGNIAGSVFKFMDDPNNIPSKGCGIEDLTIDGDNRSHTVTAAVHIDESDKFRMRNVDFNSIAGRAIYTQRCVKSSFTNIDIYLCGDTLDPSLDVSSHDAASFTQASVFSNINIEVSYSAQYLNIDANSDNNKFSNLGFESDNTIAASKQRFITCAGVANQFSMIHMNRNQGADSRILVSGIRNIFTNILSDGEHGGDCIEISGLHNVLSDIQAKHNAVGGAIRIIYINGGDYSRIANVHSLYLGGIETVAGSIGNTINGFTHYQGGGNTIKDVGGQNNYYDIVSDDFQGANPIIDLDTGSSEIHGGHLRDSASCSIGVDVDASYMIVADLNIVGLVNATGIDNNGTGNLITGNQFSNNDIPIVDIGTGTHIVGNRGDDETLTTDGGLLQYWGISEIDSNANKVDKFLGDGKYVGQKKFIVMTEASNASDLTITNHADGDNIVYTFDAVDDYLVLEWSGTEWTTLSTVGLLTGTIVWDPANLVDGAGETSAGITVAGAALGDFVLVGAPYDLEDILCTGYIQAANTIEIRLQNESTGAIDLGSGTWNVEVIKSLD